MKVDDLLQFAPDARALEGARRLFFSRRWRLLSGDGQWIWGEFEVKGGKALHTAVNLLEGQFYCDCRSKKRPCTHAIALLLKLKNRPDEWTVHEPPTWVRKLKPSSPKPKSDQPSKVSSQWPEFAPSAERKKLMSEGIADLEVRLLDILRSGLAIAAAYEPDYWLSAAARLTDAQLPGLAGRLRSLASKDPCTPQDVAAAVSDAYLLCSAWQELDRLDTARQVELYRLMGMSPKKDLVLSRPGRNDLWLVMGVVEGIEDRLRFRRVWLRGEQCQRYVLIIDYAFGDRPFERSWPLASAWSGDVHYYPGIYPRRGIFPNPKPATRAYTGLRGYDRFSELLHNYSRALALQPWLPDYPAYLTMVRPRLTGDQAFLVDPDDRSYPIEGALSKAYTLMAISAGEPISVFARFDGRSLQPLSAYVNEGLIAL
ncbi:MAG: SWIM zinc finger family protein [Bacteroidota bacterium]